MIYMFFISASAPRRWCETDAFSCCCTAAYEQLYETQELV